MQTKWHSFLEAVNNMVVGFFISWLVWMIIAGPLFDYDINSAQSIVITSLFTVTSILRQYWLRRFHNWLDHTEAGQRFKRRMGKHKNKFMYGLISIILVVTLLEMLWN